MDLPDATPVSDAPTLLALFAERVRRTPEADATWHLAPDGQVVITSWREWESKSRALAAGLLRLGLAPGTRVAVLSRTRVEWAWLDLAIMMAGGISVPIFPNEIPATCARLLQDSGAQIAIAEDPWQLRKLLEAAPAAEEALHIVLIDDETALRSGARLRAAELGVGAQGVRRFADLMHDGRSALAMDGGALLNRRLDAVLPEACVTICYTPGTEGRAKGVMLTHENLAFTSQALTATLDVSTADRQLLYLPLAQAFARLSLWFGVAAGATTAFARSYRTVFEDAATMTPTFLCGVPRLFEKAAETIQSELLSAGGFTTLAAGWVLDGRDGAVDEGFFARTRRRLGERLVVRQVASLFGGQARFVVSGGAPLGVDTARFFSAHGLPVVESYGMVETTAATHLPRLDDVALGTVGRALPGVSFRLLDDGELLIRGKNVTPGYWRNAEATRAALGEDGWFHTGDIAQVDDEGRLMVTDRKRDIIVTANGKAVAPGPIVERLRADPLIAQAYVHGDRRAFLTALVNLDHEALMRFAEARGIPGDYGALTADPRVYGAVEAIVSAVNATLSPHENIEKFAILSSELTPEGGALTPLYGLRRNVAADTYRALLDSFYSEQF